MCASSCRWLLEAVKALRCIAVLVGYGYCRGEARGWCVALRAIAQHGEHNMLLGSQRGACSAALCNPKM